MFIDVSVTSERVCGRIRIFLLIALLSNSSILVCLAQKEYHFSQKSIRLAPSWSFYRKMNTLYISTFKIHPSENSSDGGFYVFCAVF